MKQCISEAAFYYIKFGERLVAICAIFIVNTLVVGNSHYCQVSNGTEEKLKCKSREWNKAQIEHFQSEKIEDVFIMEQATYISYLEEVSHKDNYSEQR